MAQRQQHGQEAAPGDSDNRTNAPNPLTAYRGSLDYMSLSDLDLSAPKNLPAAKRSARRASVNCPAARAPPQKHKRFKSDAHQRPAKAWEDHQETETETNGPEPLSADQLVTTFKHLKLAQIPHVKSRRCGWCTSATGAGPSYSVSERTVMDTPMCLDCVVYRLQIITHPEHGKWLEIRANDLNSLPASKKSGWLSRTELARHQNCAVCMSLATVSCLGCPLRVCGDCQVALDELCAGKLNELIVMLGETGIKSDACLLWSEPVGKLIRDNEKSD